MDNINVGIPYSELGDLYTLGQDSFEVITWTPELHGKTSLGEQVHIMLHAAEDIHFVIRLKTKDAINRFIEILIDHRDTANWD